MFEPEPAVEQKRRHHIVVNRGICGRCQDEITSRHRHDYVTCSCGYFSVDGGRSYLRRAVLDVDGIEPYRDYVDTSLITQTYSRRGLLVEAYRAGITIFCTGPVGEQTTADPDDYVVYEAEGGVTAWKPAEFFANHTLQED